MGRIAKWAWVVGCVAGLVLALAPATALAAVPRRGAYESGGNAEPRVAFDVRGPGRRRVVARVSVPLTCPDVPTTVGWGWTEQRFAVRRDGRFRAYGADFVLRGRFFKGGHAAISVRMTDANCRETRRYVARRYAGRVHVRTGRYLALLGAGGTVGPVVGGKGAALYMEVTAFGRMLWVDFLEGSVAAMCSDGSQRLVPLTAPDEAILSAPIRPSGRFDITGAGAGTRFALYGSAAGGSLAAFADFTTVAPDGVNCRARGLTTVGGLAFPQRNGRQASLFPAPAGNRVEDDESRPEGGSYSGYRPRGREP